MNDTISKLFPFLERHGLISRTIRLGRVPPDDENLKKLRICEKPGYHTTYGDPNHEARGPLNSSIDDVRKLWTTQLRPLLKRHQTKRADFFSAVIKHSSLDQLLNLVTCYPGELSADKRQRIARVSHHSEIFR